MLSRSQLFSPVSIIIIIGSTFRTNVMEVKFFFLLYLQTCAYKTITIQNGNIGILKRIINDSFLIKGV